MRLHNTAVAAVLLCAATVIAQTDNQLDLARQYMQSGRYYEAQKAADSLLADNPNDAAAKEIRDNATRALRAMNDKAVADAEARYKASGSDADRFALANAYFDAGSYGAAADIYAKAPPAMMDRNARLRYAHALSWSSQLDPAERVYAELLKEQPDPVVQLEYGQLLSWMGASRAAVDRLADGYNSTHSEDAAVALANAKAWSGDREGAIRLLNDFLQTSPNSPQAKQLSVQLAASPDLRLERVNKAITLQPYNLALQVEKARLQYDAGRYASTLSTIRFIREHSSQKVEGLDELERSAREKRSAELSQLEERRRTLDAQASMASSAQNPDEILSLAKAYTGLEDYDAAITLYNRYLRLRPNDTAARIQYARVLSWDRRWAASERQYEMLLSQYPDRADLRFEYGQVQSYDADFSNALHTFRTVTDLSGNPRAELYQDVPPQAYYNIGQIYRWYGWNDHAIDAQNRALSLDAGYMPARQELDLTRHLRPSSDIEGRYSYATDSQDFTFKRMDLTAEKWTGARTAFDIGLGRHEFEHLDESVYANVISAGGQYRWSDRWTARARLGSNFYDNGLGSRPFFGFGAEWIPSLQSRASIDFNHYDLVYDVFTLTSLALPSGGSQLSITDPLTINDTRAHYDYNTGGIVAWLADASYGFISDDNHRTAAHGLMSFRVLKAPFLAFKVDGRYLRYDFRTNRYWSPDNYRSLAGVVQVGQNLRNGFHWDVEAKAGRAYESGTSSDLRAYEGSVSVPVSDLFDIVGNYGYGKSGRLQSVSPFNNAPADFVNYWQRHWYVGVRVKQLLGRGDRAPSNPYYYDSRPLAGSPVIPPLGETH
ncbi:MAG TPA: tetratricopeptide repeat protein [Thermoanaerobaculia bacterium]|nr:tetratricopeptide repeat protein [Thermoanaerobaculia bacterium]